MRWSALAIATVALVACGSSSAPRRATAPKSRRQVAAEMRSQTVLPECKGDTEGVKACGLLAIDWGQPKFLEGFKANKCPGGLDDDCRLRLREAFVVALRERYSRASEHDVEARCNAEVDCARYDLWELKWLESHNARVAGAARRAIETRDEYDERERERERAAVAAEEAQARAVMAAFAGFARASEGTRSSGCVDSYYCQPGFRCVIASGDTRGQCLAVR